MFILILRVR